MLVNVVGNGSAGQRHARLISGKGHTCTVLGPDKASPATHPPCDAVVIASPPATHKLYLSWYRDKHILCEGPVTWVPPARPGLVHMTASNWRFIPQIQALAYECAKRNPVHAHFWFDYDLRKWRLNWDYRESCYYTDGIDWINVHDIDLALFLLGNCVQSRVLKAERNRSLGVDAAVFCLRHESGALSTINLSWFSSVYRRGIQVYFDDGSYEELLFGHPNDDPVVNQSYDDMVSWWLAACQGSQLPECAATLADGHRVYQVLQCG